MARLTCQVARMPTSNLPRDRIINVVHFDTTDPGTDPDHASLGDDLLEAFDTHLTPINAFTGWECRIYDKADAEPREPRATVTRAQGGSAASPGPFEVALCLSFFAERNIPRRRGRIYLGPWTQGSMAERPSATNGPWQSAMNLGAALAGIGGLNVSWVVYSPTTDQSMGVTDYWCDDAWDTMRGRGLRATTRLAATT
jgi:hypothetical protein